MTDTVSSLRTIQLLMAIPITFYLSKTQERNGDSKNLLTVEYCFFSFFFSFSLWVIAVY